MGLLPDTFWQLSPGELMSLQEHHRIEAEYARENAAFTGYCAAAAVASAFSEGLPSFDEFYHPTQTLSGDELEAECIAKGLKLPD